MKTKQISLAEYADKINPLLFRSNRTDQTLPITKQAIKYRISNGIELPEVIKHTKIGKVHVLTVAENFGTKKSNLKQLN
jgi:hypothetical protein